MELKIRFWLINDVLYTTSKEIELFAEKLGKTPYKDLYGRSHPGTACNRILKSALAKDPSPADSYIVSFPYHEPKNSAVIDSMIVLGQVALRSVTAKPLDLYTQKAAELILRSMTGLVKIYPELIEYDYRYGKYELVTVAKKLDPQNDTPALFKTPEPAKPKTLLEQEFTLEEQEVIRRYQRRIAETRRSGKRPYHPRTSKREK